MEGLWVPSAGMEVVQNSQKFLVLGCGRTELTEVLGIVARGRTEQNSQKFRACTYKNIEPAPRVLWHTGVHNPQKFRVRV